jgi:hypothetical protein
VEGGGIVEVEMAKWSIATEESLKAELLEFEQRYGIDSFELRRLHATDEAPERIPPDQRLIWCSTLDLWTRARARKQVMAARPG